MAIYLVKPGANGMIEARRMAKELDGPMRAPHHSCSQIALLSEIAMSAGGVLWLDAEGGAWVHITIRTVMQMHPKARPVVFIGLSGDEDQKSLKAYEGWIEAFGEESDKRFPGWPTSAVPLYWYPNSSRVSINAIP